MKKQAISVLALLLFGSTMAIKAQQREFSETITKEIALANTTSNTLVIKNVFGSIDIQGYNGDKIMLEVKRSIHAKSDEHLELGKRELQLKITSENNRVILRPDAPYIDFDENHLKYNWCNNEEIPYDHLLDFKVRVPWSIQIHASTVNDGEVNIRETKGEYLKASNINGGITLHDVTGQTDLHCINGDVSITYNNNPAKDSKYYSLNGDINVKYQNGLSAQVSFKSLNGELFTDFDIEKQYMDTKRSSEKQKAKYKYEATPKMQIGNGAVALDFETLNGNVYLKRI